MTIDSFAAFYKAVHHGNVPFFWQEELLRRVVAEGWPGTVAMPTSSGKTSAIDVAVFHLALEGGKSTFERRSSLRMFFIVDRRIVVDEAFEHAERIAEQLITSTDPVVRDVAAGLNAFQGRLPLQVSRMRGGMLRDNGWADEPNQPTVCLSTVDQVGSRLLFRGYQVGERSRSVHAGLIGNDSLLILDEAHLSNPFLETLQAITNRYAKWGDKLPARPPTVVQMSATTSGTDVFRLKEEWIERDARILGARLRASKPAELREGGKKFEEEMAAAARELGNGIGAGVVGVIANTVGSAREIFNKLSGDKVLLIGRNRPWCAEQLWRSYHDRIAARYDRERDGLMYVVATQTVEVGANIDFDALVSEAAPLDSLRQRFGRLNRLGRSEYAKAIIVLRPKEDLVYGLPTKTTWEFLSARKPLDFGVSAMDALLAGVDIQELNSKRPGAPLLLPGHLEWWAQTSPAPEPNPDVAPFLHGPDATDAAEVQIVWRADLVTGEEEAKWERVVELMPPVQREALTLPIGAVRRWLRDQAQDVTDVEGMEVGNPEEDTRQAGRKVVRWCSGGATVEWTSAIRPGDTIIVPSDYGGADPFGWNPKDKSPVADIADEVNKEEAEAGVRRRRIRLELAVKRIAALAPLIEAFREDPDTATKEAILNQLEISAGQIDSDARVVICPLKAKRRQIEPMSEESDETDDSSMTSKQSLASHTAGVVEHAERFAAGCGVSAKLASDIRLAARLHDWGKCDERFQSWLAGRPFYGGEYLAKSKGNRSQGDNAKLRKQAGYPDEARHEAASVMAACASGLLGDANDRDLVLHLIGTHHGCGRPFFPVWNENPEFKVAVEAEGLSFETSSGHELARIDSGWADRFAMLNRRYGYWGLAYLEAILRRADCMQSRKEEESVTNQT